MKKSVIIAAVAALAVTACQQVTVPLTCEGIATGIDIVVRNEKALKDSDLIIVKNIRDEVAPICLSEKQPTTSDAAKHLVETNAKRLNEVLSNYSKKELSQ